MSGKVANQRIKAEKIFTDRVEPRAAFDRMLNELTENPDGIFVLSYYGIGGIGKTKLLEILANKVPNDIIQVKYDFNYGTNQRDIIMALRNLLVAKGFAFYFLDEAEKNYIEKSGRITDKFQKQEKKNFLTDNPYVDLAMDISGAGFAVKGINALMGTAAYIREKVKEKPVDYTEIVREMRQKEAHQVLADFPEYFSRDLEYNIKCTGKPIIIMLDTYEMLVDTYAEKGHQSVADHWLREQIVDMVPGVMWVIAGRERLDWAKKDKSWENVIDEHRLGDLGEKDCYLFLETAQIPSSLWKGIYEITQGIPAFLDICVEEYYLLKSKGNSNISIQMLAGDSGKKEELLERFIRYMNVEEREITEVQSMFGVWEKNQVEQVCRNVYGRFNERIYNETLEHSIIYLNEYNLHYMHDLVRKFVIKYMEPELRKKLYIEMTKITSEMNYLDESTVMRCISLLPEMGLTVREFGEVYYRFLKHICYYMYQEKVNRAFLTHTLNNYIDADICKAIEEKYLLENLESEHQKMLFYLFEALRISYGEKDDLTLKIRFETGWFCKEQLEKAYVVSAVQNLLKEVLGDDESRLQRCLYFDELARYFLGELYNQEEEKKQIEINKWDAEFKIVERAPLELPVVDIDGLKLSVRSYNSLRRAGINTLDELCKLSVEELCRIRNLTGKCQREIHDRLMEAGLEFNFKGMLEEKGQDEPK